jgi:hypothetical protein
METNIQKPLSDLERIQRSYTSGGQTYTPANQSSRPTPSRQEITNGPGKICNAGLHRETNS